MVTQLLAAPGKYLSFALGDEEYALPVMRVREIIKMMDITQVPRVPPHVKGVINLRGRVIPIIDLRIKFGFGAPLTERTCIIVVETAFSSGPAALGVVVDGVSEVLTLTAEEIGPPPDFGDRIDAGYMQGIARGRGGVTVLLDLDRVVGPYAVRAYGR